MALFHVRYCWTSPHRGCLNVWTTIIFVIKNHTNYLNVFRRKHLF